MRCSILFAVTVFVLIKVSTGNIKLFKNGYENVNIVITDHVKEDPNLIENIKVAFTAASALLFKATKNHTYFKNITIVIPKKWKQLDSNLTQPSLGKLGEHVRVDRKNRAKGNAPYVRGNLECGKPGWFMHLTPDFLNTHGDTAYGPHANVIVHEWGHLRWGLFDEYASIPYPGTTKPNQKIQFYNTKGQWRPATCSGDIKGGAYSHNCNVTKPCDLKSIMMPSQCKFCPDRQQTAKASLMSSQWIHSLDSFCDEDSHLTDPAVRHNSKSPNAQNYYCNGQSAWEVMKKHPDFKDGNDKTTLIDTDTVPTFSIVKETGRVRVIVYDVSYGMHGSSIGSQKHAISVVIDNVIETGSWLGLVPYSRGTTIMTTLTEITSRNIRSEMKQQVQKLADPYASYCWNSKGRLEKAVKVIADSQFSTHGTEIILLSDCEIINYSYIVSTLQTKGITVHTISTQNADADMAKLAAETGGNSYTYLKTNSMSLTDVLSQAISAGTTDIEAIEKVVCCRCVVCWIGIKQCVEGRANVKAPVVGLDSAKEACFYLFSEKYGWYFVVFGSKTYINSTQPLVDYFTIDDGLGNTTTITIIQDSFSYPITINIASPDGYMYTNTSSEDIMSIYLDDNVQAGRYDFNISTERYDRAEIEVIVTTHPVSDEGEVLRVTSSFSNSAFDFSIPEEIRLYTNVEKGGTPVLNANVTAILAGDIELFMKDTGTGADLIANDGVYSVYLLSTYFTSNRQYNVKVTVTGDGRAFTYTAGVSGESRASSIPGAVDEIELTPVPLDEFQRQSIPGVITVLNRRVNDERDTIPPAKISDLRVESITKNNETENQTLAYTFAWTAVGDNMTIGTAAAYVMRMDMDNQLVRKYFINAVTVPVKWDQPKPSGETERYTVNFSLDDCNGTCFLALLAIDRHGLISDISNFVNIDINFSYDQEDVYTDKDNVTTITKAGLSLYAIIGIAIGGSVFLIIAVVLVSCFACRRRSLRS